MRRGGQGLPEEGGGYANARLDACDFTFRSPFTHFPNKTQIIQMEKQASWDTSWLWFLPLACMWVSGLTSRQVAVRASSPRGHICPGGERGGHRCELPPRPKVGAPRPQTARRLKDVSAAKVSSDRTPQSGARRPRASVRHLSGGDSRSLSAPIPPSLASAVTQTLFSPL